MKSDAAWQHFLATCNEYGLWHIIEGYGSAIWNIKHDIWHERYELDSELEQWLDKAHERIKQAVEETARFGVENPHTEEGEPSVAYQDWYRSWKAKEEKVAALLA